LTGEPARPPTLSTSAASVIELLTDRGASFAHEIAAGCEFDFETVLAALAQLVGAGLVTSDGFGGLRMLVHGKALRSQLAGRWSLVQTLTPARAGHEVSDEERVEFQARALLRRYGVVFRRLLTREPGAISWRDLVRMYRTLESRGELRGGRFVSGMSGEQFATPSAVERLREVRRTPGDGRLIAVTASDPLNLAGIVTAGDRIRVQAGNRVLYRNGVPLAALEGEFLRPLTDLPAAVASQVASALAGRSLPAVTSGYVGRSR